MSRGRYLFFAVSLALVLPIMSVSLWAAAARADGEPGDDSLYKYLSVFTEVLGLVRQAYVDESDVDSLMVGALDGATEAMDPFSLYIPAGENGYQASGRLDPGPTGLLVLKERGIAYVAAIAPGSAADAGDFERGDIVAEVAGRETRLLPLWQIWRLFDGKPGTEIQVQLVRLGEPLSVNVTLAEPVRLAASLTTHDGVPVLALPQVGRETPLEVRRLLEGAPDTVKERLVIDLRGTAFGEPAAAYELGKVFASGELGALVDRGEVKESFTGSPAPLWQGGRLVVLVDRGTLSGAEVLAAILQQRAGAALVGVDTFGHAGKPELVQLSSGARLQVTSAFYTGPDREPIDAGLEPDLVVDELTRTFDEHELSLEELILRRGLDLVRKSEPLPRKQAA